MNGTRWTLAAHHANGNPTVKVFAVVIVDHDPLPDLFDFLHQDHDAAKAHAARLGDHFKVVEVEVSR
jgi:hypothetical protein